MLQALLCPVLYIICIDCRFHRIVDPYLALARTIVQIFYDLFHRHNRLCIKSIQLFDLVERALDAAFPYFHPVQGYHQTPDFHIRLRTDDRECLLDRLSGRRHILNDDHAVAVF